MCIQYVIHQLPLSVLSLNTNLPVCLYCMFICQHTVNEYCIYRDSLGCQQNIENLVYCVYTENRFWCRRILVNISLRIIPRTSRQSNMWPLLKIISVRRVFEAMWMWTLQLIVRRQTERVCLFIWGRMLSCGAKADMCCSLRDWTTVPSKWPQTSHGHNRAKRL